jgi:tetratricopeptide (TPR) repeat protein
LEGAESSHREALGIRKRLAAEYPNRPGYRDDLAQSHENLGNVLRQRGQTSEAKAAYRDALAIRKVLVADFPDRPEYHHTLATTQGRLGTLLRKIGQPKDAAAALGEALARLKELTVKHPARPDFRSDLARYSEDMGIQLYSTGRPKEAVPHCLDALALWKKLAAEFPHRPGFRRHMALTLKTLGDLLFTTNRPKEAEEAYQEALTIQEQMATAFPNQPDVRDDLAATRDHLAILLSRTGRHNEAAAASRAALAIRKQLAAKFPQVPDYQNDLAGTLANRASLHSQRREFAAAVALLEQARPHHLAALKANPTNSTYRGFYRNNLWNLAANCRALADHARLAATADELAQFAAELPNDLYDALSSLGHAVTFARKDARLADARRKELANQYADRALDLLRQAVALGYADPARFPARPQYRQHLALCYSEVGIVLNDIHRPEEAEEAYREALAIQKTLAAEFPSVADYQNDLAGTLVNRASLHSQRREFAAAVALLEQARPHHLAALKANPKDAAYRQFYRNNLWNLARNYRALADHARLAATADELAQFAVAPANDPFVAACHLGCCVTLADKDAQLPEARRKELAKRYADGALALLRQAVAAGFKDADRLNKNPDLEPLRGRAEFKKLLADLKGKNEE